MGHGELFCGLSAGLPEACARAASRPRAPTQGPAAPRGPSRRRRRRRRGEGHTPARPRRRLLQDDDRREPRRRRRARVLRGPRPAGDRRHGLHRQGAAGKAAALLSGHPHHLHPSAAQARHQAPRACRRHGLAAD
ncbi:hypothetical protein FOCC_FOCC014309 [Frankliniella occidentalis]|nr:hypothetical protein FOCC_FOCC014309 [Frankliniella occidentalis]